MITLYQMPRMGLDLMNPSPFCMKVELYLRLAGLDYETRETLDLRKSPKGKLPWIVESGQALGDSQHIVEHLQRTRRKPVPDVSDADDPPLAHAIRKMLEESLYFALVYSRWLDDRGWAQTRPLFFGRLPVPLRAVVPTVARRGLRKSLFAQGMGRHDPAETAAMGAQDLDALAAYLGAREWANGSAPGVLDAVCYAFIANIIEPPIETPLKRHALAQPALVAYADRMRKRSALAG